MIRKAIIYNPFPTPIDAATTIETNESTVSGKVVDEIKVEPVNGVMRVSLYADTDNARHLLAEFYSPNVEVFFY